MKGLPIISIGLIMLGIFIIAGSMTHSEDKKVHSVPFENEMKLFNGRYLYKIFYEGHSYIFLRNTWSSNGDNLIHDPGCKCNKKEAE